MKKYSLFLIAVSLSILMVWGIVSYQGPTRSHRALLTYDYGILSEFDLSISDRWAEFKPLGSKVNAYEFWQCFPKSMLTVECSYSYPLDEMGSHYGLTIETGSAEHSYSISHAISGEACDEKVSEIRTVLRNQGSFCIRGQNDALTFENGKQLYAWTFRALKTKSGTVYYFENEADEEIAPLAAIPTPTRTN